MQLDLDWVIDLGNLGERPCSISAVINADHFHQSYHIVIKHVTTTIFGDLDLARLLTRQSREIIEGEIIDTYETVMEATRDKLAERRAARGTPVVEAWI